MGMKVSIRTSQGKSSTGFVEEIAPRNPFSEQGIMVRLNNGDIGRVKKILYNDKEMNDKSTVEIKNLIKTGENFHTEFKAEAFWSATFNPIQIKESKSFELREYGQKASKVIIAKSIAAFLNSSGGNLIIGIKEKKDEGKFEVIGINEDMKKIKDQSLDGYKRAILDEIIKSFFPSRIFNHLNDYITIEFVVIEDKTLCWIKIKKGDSWTFLKVNDRDIFMIRIDSQNRTLEGEKLVNYCVKKWGNG